ncbi:MAG: hypothetical protein CLLPBCKN_007820 [Chroococcidiopsis cubana SAG 39.79]|jgi:hypothetical protein|uniref:Uncharacterized protein n=2 Tax=Chroococcidiopsis TaxID=54298 RepID=K9U8E7_CHRTP|nr:MULTISPECIES: hypothetical protein [Chroococcidiopsis]PSB43329.1 hypothetical protein C7B80_24530 [Cyanosarcina cf. burmensis CCALA 770]AFY90519.1 hypothetical protein Chro_5147 [Chroococcidiopsis thermalis PCC 7203]MDZ4878385.1 hypothetical protein [Chroococcidiopsis cubana SAG 39.79]PSB65853.1 hypothetical protein C7B79_03580 [Chroococcidiopsis cubana CCALA 043]RUT14257.1 hypothetical protein DSM107010_02880 [Chroococcidiopsis cubana SAG 39.79]
MAHPATDTSRSEDSQIWDELKSAIAASSGFQRWRLEKMSGDRQLQEVNLDRQVSLYLRETLETLAY